jgi:uncharacterized protein (DUF1501 family)
MITRRGFLHHTGIAVGAFGLAPAWLVRAAAAGAANGTRRILLAIFQRGAADALNVVVPVFEQRYYDLRPGIAVPRPGTPLGAVDLDGRFALHPALQPLKRLWDTRQLAIVHAVGSPDPTRSHFDAQDFMESGTAGVRREDGWLNRTLPAAGTDASPMRAVAVGAQMPRALKGERSAVVIDDLSRFQLPSTESAAVLERLYATSSEARLSSRAQGAFEAAKRIEALRRQAYIPADGAQYIGAFGQRLQQIAQLIKADVGVEVASADIDGWDHHANEAPQLNTVLREFGTSLAAFAIDMGDRMADIVVVTMSEFGRTVAQNGAAGTDHGHGGVMMVLGGPVRGGSIFGTWPGLRPEQLYEGRDLAVTTDFRDVLGELVQGHLGQDPARVFPEHRRNASSGLLRI